MRNTHRRIALQFAALSLVAISLQAQNQASLQGDPNLVTGMTLEAFQQKVQVLGFSTTRGSANGKQDSYFTFMAEGRKVGGLALSPTILELFISYKDGALPEDLNEWNRNHFGTAAFVDQNGNAVLRSDLLLEGGVADQNVNAFIIRFRDAAGAFARFIVDHKKKS